MSRPVALWLCVAGAVIIAEIVLMIDEQDQRLRDLELAYIALKPTEPVDNE